MRLAAFQFDVHAGDAAANLARAMHALEHAASEGCALVCLPEMWPTSFPDGGGATAPELEATERALASIAARSAELEIVVCGSAFATDVALGAKPPNRLHAIAGGRDVLSYDKLHLFTPTAEPEVFTAGDAPPRVVDSAVGRLSGLICYDLRFPEVARAAFHGGVEVLVVPAQWPTPRAAHWRALCIARAIETQCFVVAANRTGRARVGRRRMELEFGGGSLVVSPLGEVLAEGGADVALVHADVDFAEARRFRTRVPIAKDDRRELYARWTLGERAAQE